MSVIKIDVSPTITATAVRRIWVLVQAEMTDMNQTATHTVMATAWVVYLGFFYRCFVISAPKSH